MPKHVLTPLMLLLVLLHHNPAAGGCGCQKQAKQSTLRLQEEARRMKLASQRERERARQHLLAGNVAQAREAFQRAVQLARQELEQGEGGESPAGTVEPLTRFARLHLAEIQREYGGLLGQQSNWTEAATMFEESLVNDLAAGRRPEDVEMARETLITLYRTAGNPEKSLSHYQALIELREATSGRYSHAVAELLRGYAQALRGCGRLGEANAMEQRSKAITAAQRRSVRRTQELF